MKTRFKIKNFLTGASIAAILTAAALKSSADDKTPDAKAQTAAKAQMRGYDLVISDGELIEPDGRRSTAQIPAVMDALRKRYPEANIVIAPELMQVVVADMKLHAHNLPEMLDAIGAASGDKFFWVGPNSRSGAIDPATGLPLTVTPQVRTDLTSDINSGLFTLRASGQTKEPERVVEAFNISSYLETRQREARDATDRANQPVGTEQNLNFNRVVLDDAVKQLEDLILATVADFKHVSQDDVRRSMTFQFHGGAMLFIVIGSKPDVEVARKLAGALASQEPRNASFTQQYNRIINAADDAQKIVSGSSAGHSSMAPEPITMQVFPLKNASIASASQAIAALLTNPHSKVIPDERTKTLAVIGTKAELVTVKKAIEDLDGVKPYVGDNPVVH